MTREPSIDVFDPSVEEIHRLMEQVSHDDDDPLIVLKAFPAGASETHELWIARLNSCETGSFAGWLIRLKDSSNKTSVVLAIGNANQTQFQRYELFGSLEDIRSECVPPQAVIDEAIQWFLITGNGNPSLAWLDFLQSVQTV